MSDSRAASDGSRALHFALLGVTALVVLSPALSRTPKDDYPLSNYPMFATNKDPKTTVSQAVAIAPAGITVLGPRFVGTDEVLQARHTIARAVRAKGADIQTLCTDVAARVAANGDLASATHVEIRTVTHDSLVYFGEGDHKPAASTTHARCPVSRSR
jgi:hypothetical protein